MNPIRLTLIASLSILPVVTASTIAFAQPVLAQTSNDYTGVAKQVDEIAEKITVLINSSNNGNGSGAIIAKQGDTYYVLTAAHVVQNPDSYSLVAPDGTTYQLDNSQMTVLKEVDLAVVQFTAKKAYSIATIARYNFKDNFWVFVSGFPKSAKGGQAQRLLTAGTLQKQEGADFLTKDQYSLSSGGRGLLYTSLSLAGMSGGPVLDSRGYVIGINTASENELGTTLEGQTVEISLGFSLGVPIGTFVTQTEKTKVQSQWLQLVTTSPPELTFSESESIIANLGRVPVPSKNASATDWLNYGNQLWRFGRYKEAVSAFDKAIALSNDFDRAYYGKGLALWHGKQYSEALAAFEKATQLDPNFPAAWRYQGDSLGKLKKYDLALAAYDKAIELQPDNFVLHVERGLILDELKRLSEALTAYNTAIKLKSHSWAYNNHGIVFYELKDYQKALADYNSALSLNPDNEQAYNNRGKVYHDIQEYQKALADFNSALSLNPDYLEAYNNRGNVYADIKEYQKAIADYDRAIFLNPDDADGYNNRGTVYSELNEYQKALLDFERAIALTPNDADIYSNRGNVYTGLQDYQKALVDYNRAIALNPNSAGFYSNRGLVYAFLKEYQKAIADYDRAIAIDPDIAQAYNNRGLAYDALKEYQNAIADYNRAIALNPNFAEAYGNRGLVYARLGEMENAIADSQKAAELFCQQGGPYCQQAREILRQLQGGVP